MNRYCKPIWQKFGFTFSVKLCPEEYKYAYDDGDMCCSVDKEKEYGGHSGEFALNMSLWKNKR